MILYDTKYLQLKSTMYKDNEPWVYAHRPNASDVVVILPIIERTKVLFLIEKRPPITAEYGDKYTIGVPAGLVGDERHGETISDAIKAELLEETGLEADRIEIKAKKIASSAGCVSETYTIAFAYVNKYKIIKTPIDDNGVIIDRELVDIEKISDRLRECEEKGMVLTSQMLSALYYLKKEI